MLIQEIIDETGDEIDAAHLRDRQTATGFSGNNRLAQDLGGERPGDRNIETIAIGHHREFTLNAEASQPSQGELNVT